MTMTIIDCLEPIKVDKQNCKWVIAPLPSERNGIRQAAFEQPSIGQSRQRIMKRTGHQRRLRFFDAGPLALVPDDSLQQSPARHERQSRANPSTADGRQASQCEIALRNCAWNWSVTTAAWCVISYGRQALRNRATGQVCRLWWAQSSRDDRGFEQKSQSRPGLNQIRPARCQRTFVPIGPEPKTHDLARLMHVHARSEAENVDCPGPGTALNSLQIVYCNKRQSPQRKVAR